MKAFILAAGFGKRLRPITETTPKPLIPLNGKPLIAYHLENLKRAGVQDVVVNVHWLADQIIDYLGDGSEFGLNIQFSHEAELLETGGGILKALPLLGDAPFLLVNGDVYIEYTFSELLGHQLGDNLAHLLLVENPSHNGTGDFSINDFSAGSGQLRRHESDNEFTYAGVALIRPMLFNEWMSQTGPFALLSPLLSAAINNRLSGELFQGVWEDVGTIERLEKLDRSLKE